MINNQQVESLLTSSQQSRVEKYAVWLQQKNRFYFLLYIHVHFLATLLTTDERETGQ